MNVYKIKNKIIELKNYYDKLDIEYN